MCAISHHALVETANALPALPEATTQLQQLYADVDYELRDVVSVVELDPTLVGRLLRVANSAVYGSRSVASAQEAIMRVGSGAVLSLSMMESVRPVDDIDLSAFGLTTQTYWTHSVATMVAAEELLRCQPRSFQKYLPMAALLHDFGKIVLAKFVTPEHQERMAAFPADMSHVEREMRVLGVNHAEVTAVICQAWKLPDALVRAVQYHHTPGAAASKDCDGLCVANDLAKRIDGSLSLDAEFTAVAMQSLETLALTDDDIEKMFVKMQARYDEVVEVI